MAIFGNTKKVKALEDKILEQGNKLIDLEKRDIWTTLPLNTLQSIFGVPYKSTFEINKTLTLSAVYCAINKISDSLATLDLKLYQVDEQGFKRELHNNLYDLLTLQPNWNMSKFNMWKVAGCNLLTSGNAYILIVRDPNGNPIEFRLLPPNTVAKGNVNGQKKWKVTGYQHLIDDTDILHFINYPDPDDYEQGISVLQYARNSLGGVYNIEQQANDYSLNGSSSLLYIKTEGQPTPTQKTDLRQDLRNTFNPTTGQKDPPIIGGGMDLKTLGISPKDGQFLESRQWSITEISRWFNISPALLFDNSKQLSGTVEAMQIEYLNTTLQPILQKIQNECYRKLVLPKDRQKLILAWDLTDLIRMDSVAQMNYYTTGINNGIWNRNEAAKNFPNTNFAEGGDDYKTTVQQQSLKNPVVVGDKVDNNLKK
jgi:HK97 family phage portal protein